MDDEGTNTRRVDSSGAFEQFVVEVEPRLRNALASTYGPAAGREAALDALAWAWTNWERVQSFDNPVGYLYRVGQSAARRQLRQSRRQRTLASGEVETSTWDRRQDEVEATHVLEPALKGLTEQQRAAVVLVHGYGMTLRDVAQVMDISVATVREHTKRALRRLRTTLEVNDAV